MLGKFRSVGDGFRGALLPHKSCLLFIDGIGDFCCLTEEIKIFSYRLRGAPRTGLNIPKCVGVEVVICIFKLITKTVVCVIEVDTGIQRLISIYLARTCLVDLRVVIVLLLRPIARNGSEWIWSSPKANTSSRMTTIFRLGGVKSKKGHDDYSLSGM